MPVTASRIDELAASHDIITLGMHADEARRERHGTRTTFVRTADVPAADGTPVTCPAAAGEVRIVGELTSLDAAVRRVADVVAAARGVPVSGYSLADIEALSVRAGTTVRAVLEALRAAGLELVAYAPFERLQDPRRSVEEVNIAGLTVARLSIDALPSADVPSLYRRVADVQRSVAVIRAFAPLPRRINPAVPTTGFDDIKRVALARLIVDNVETIQIDWALYGPKLAQVALTVGADDVDGVSADDDVSQGPRRTALEDVRRNIRAAGFEPFERNGRFDVIV